MKLIVIRFFFFPLAIINSTWNWTLMEDLEGVDCLYYYRTVTFKSNFTFFPAPLHAFGMWRHEHALTENKQITPKVKNEPVNCKNGFFLASVCAIFIALLLVQSGNRLLSMSTRFKPETTHNWSLCLCVFHRY